MALQSPADLEQIISPVATGFQMAGAIILALILWRVSRSTGLRSALIWTRTWIFLFLALLSVRVYIATTSRWTWPAYLLLEWAALAFLVSGARHYATGREIPPRRIAIYLPVAIIAASLIVQVPDNFNQLFSFQAVALLTGFLSTYVVLGLAPPDKRGFGWQIARIALAVSILTFALYIPAYWMHSQGYRINALIFAPLVDFLAEVVLGIGMVLMAADEARRQLDGTVQELLRARDRLEEAARTDPLTQVLNRHAFYSMIPPGQPNRALRGSVVMIDVDQLKQINDTIGHQAGDSAIRASANEIRRLIRADDLLFRWGGDEFVVLLPNLDMQTASARLQALASGIPFRPAEGSAEQPLSLSWGVASFGDGVSVQDAIAIADAEMYRRRAARRSGEHRIS